MLQLKPYQERSLEALARYLRLARARGADTAFVLETGRPYNSVPQLPSLPYVCLRMPTGGGKTLAACHAVGLVKSEFLNVENVLCLWLVPSNTIREQTLRALRDRGHFYRQALEAGLPGSIQVLDLQEALYVQRSVLDAESVVIVSTLAALRVQDTEGRKIYETSGALDHHFSGLAPAQLDALERDSDGTFPKSLANVLRLRRPIIIMDEAHNARTPLSFETLARLQPSVIVELTATPAIENNPRRERFASNVLHQVSAAELKVAEMVKLPIELVTRREWQEALQDAIAKQRELETAAERERSATGERLRPIVLLQAQPRSEVQQTLSVERLKDSLIREFQIPAEQIAVEAYDQHDLEDVNLEADGCAVRFILTVQKLREGWDCPWAYVLGSVAQQHSATAVEQILGRVLRLPGARLKQEPLLNRAYAFASSDDFVTTAQSLRDALVESGFQPIEARHLVQAGASQGELPLFVRRQISVSQPPRTEAWPESLTAKVAYSPATGALEVTGNLSAGEIEIIAASFESAVDQREVRQRVALSWTVAPPPLRVPRLAILVGSQLELLTEDHIAEEVWGLAEADPRLSDHQFPTSSSAAQMGEIDVREDDSQLRIVTFSADLERQLSLLAPEPGGRRPN